MEAKCLVQKGNTLTVELTVTNSCNMINLTTIMSPAYIISGSIVFQLRVIAALISDGRQSRFNNLVCIRITRHRPHENDTYTMKFTSNKLGVKNMCFTSDDSTWRLVNENKAQQQYTIDVTVQIDVVPSTSTFVPLHEDTKLADFELRGEDGSVRFHKAVLAAASPVFRQMLEGTWQETTEGRVDIQDTSKNTLQHFKDYIYLRTLPDEDLEQLLLLSSYYMMPDLEYRCVDRLVYNLTAQNACDLLEFATKHKVPRLLLAILECVQKSTINVDEMRDHILPGEKKDYDIHDVVDEDY